MSTLRRRGRFYNPANHYLLAIILFCLNFSTVLAQTIAAIGDYGVNDINEANVAALVKSLNPDFIITLGDNNYPIGASETIDENIGQYYQEYIYPYIGSYGTGDTINRFFPSIGNHDAATLDGQPYLDYFALPGNERYYDIVKGNVHLFSINSDGGEPDGNDSSSIQAQWLKRKLENSNANWKIVYFHHPAYSPSSKHGSTVWMQWPFQKWGASAVIGGHDHTYERIMINGLPYFVNGLGGRYPYGFGDPLKGSAVRYNDDFGAMIIEANSDSIQFKFINLSNELIDCFSLGGKNSSCIHEVCDSGEPHLQVSPNPIDGIATLKYCVFVNAPVVVRIYNSQGDVVETLVDNSDHKPGRYQVILNSMIMDPGIYFCELSYGKEKKVKKIVVIGN